MKTNGMVPPVLSDGGEDLRRWRLIVDFLADLVGLLFQIQGLGTELGRDLPVEVGELQILFGIIRTSPSDSHIAHARRVIFDLEQLGFRQTELPDH